MKMTNLPPPKRTLRRRITQPEQPVQNIGKSMQICGVVGWSGSGKTTVITQIIPELRGRGISISTMKHAHHHFDIDTPGKDSYEHRKAGAVEVLVTSDERWALMHENLDDNEQDLEVLLGRMTPVDLLLIEGFKNHTHKKLEIHRPSLGKPLLAPDDNSIIAIASDATLNNINIPVLDLAHILSIADFIVAKFKLTGLKKNGTA